MFVANALQNPVKRPLTHDPPPSPLNSALYGVGRLAQVSKPSVAKSPAASPLVAALSTPADVQSPSSSPLADALFGRRIADGTETPDIGRIRAESTAMRGLLSQIQADPIRSTPARDAAMAQESPFLNAIQGIPKRLAENGNSQLGYAGARPGSGVDEGMAAQMQRANQMGRREALVGGATRGGQYGIGSTVFAGGELIPTASTRQPFTREMAARRDAAVERLATDPAAVASRKRLRVARELYGNERGMSPEQQELFAAYQERRDDRRENALTMRAAQSLHRAQEQARAREVAAQNPLNSPAVQAAIGRDPRAAVSVLDAILGREAEIATVKQRTETAAADRAERAREFDVTSMLEGRGLKNERRAARKAANFQRDELSARSLQAEADRNAAAARQQAELEAERPLTSARARAEEARAKAEEARAGSLDREGSKEQRLQEIIVSILPKLSAGNPELADWLVMRLGELFDVEAPAIPR